MKLGGFGFIEDYEKICEAGFDYAELDLPEIESLNEEEYSAFRQRIEKMQFPILTGARLFPITDQTFFQEEFDPETLRDYVERTCFKSSGLGIKRMIMGNGKARWQSLPIEKEREDRFVRFLQMICDIAAKYGQEFIFEPLGPKYSNYINTLPEAVQLIKKVGRDNAFIMADLRHMVWSGEAFDDLLTWSAYIHHIHMDYPLSYPERHYPSPEDGYHYSTFLKKLRDSGYQDTITIEADIPKDWKKAHDQAIEAFQY